MSAPGPAVVVADLRIDIAGTGDDIVDEISFAIQPGEVLGLVGESGSGKTTAALALLGHTRRGAQIAGGSVTVGDVDILKLGAGARRRIRGRVVSYVPQDPAASLNPALRVGTQLLEALQVHGYLDNDEQRRERVAEMMREVALPDDPAYLRRFRMEEWVARRINNAHVLRPRGQSRATRHAGRRARESALEARSGVRLG